MADKAVRDIAAASLPAFQKSAGPGVVLKVDGASIVSDEAGANAEYRDGKPWVFRAVAMLSGGA